MKLEQYKLKNVGISRWFIYVLTLCIACSFILLLLKSKPNLLPYIKTFLAGNQSLDKGDSWTPMIEAIIYLKKNPDGSVYDVMFLRGIKFQYPLSSLLLFDFPNLLAGWSYVKIIVWLDYISRLSIIGTALISAKILTNILKQDRFEKLRISSNMETIVLYVLVGALTLMFYPLMRSYYLGQIQTLLTFFAALSILCWQYKKKALTGLLIGLICVIKPQLAVLFLWGLLRRQWSMVISGAIVVGIFLLISIGMYGFHNNLQYLQVLSFLSHHGETFYANQSVNGLVNRLTFNGPNTGWDGKFPPYSSTVYIFTLISSLFFMLLGLLWNYKDRDPGIIDFSIIIMCTTMASPIAWEHHYGILLSIFVLLSPYAYSFYRNKKWRLILLSLAFLLTSQYFEWTKYFAGTSLNIIQSYLFFGACIILFFLFDISRKLNKPNVRSV